MEWTHYTGLDPYKKNQLTRLGLTPWKGVNFWPHHEDPVQPRDLREDKPGLRNGRRSKVIRAARPSKDLHTGEQGQGSVHMCLEPSPPGHRTQGLT